MITLPMYSVKLHKDYEIDLPGNMVSRPDQAALIAQHLLKDYEREHLLALFINVRGEVKGLHIVAIGHASGVNTTPKEVFRAALISGQPAMVLAHNHPSSALYPSPQDIEMTIKIVDIGKMLHISILDHIIVGSSGFRSMSPEFPGGFL